MSHLIVRRLRPYLFHGFRHAQSTRTFSRTACLPKEQKAKDVTHDYEKRVVQLESHAPRSEWYPRLEEDSKPEPIQRFKRRCNPLEPGDTIHDDEGPGAKVAGRVRSVRTAGSKLVFLDIGDGTETIQVVCKLSKPIPGASVEHEEEFRDFVRTVRKGDWYSVTGVPHKTSRGEPSILAAELPRLLSPSLHQIPDTLDDAETRAKNRHVEMLVNPASIRSLRVRHLVERELDIYFHMEHFTKVHTPILTAGAGGAIARPFETKASELEGQKLHLRIAPELWLKRLVVGGMHKIYEVGPAFRNEGVDATHNPEFTICEFYEAFATLESLMERTETLFHSMELDFDEYRVSQAGLDGLPKLPVSLRGPYPRLEFIPTMERELGRQLPDLTSPDAQQEVMQIFHDKDLTVPAQPTLPRLLDALAGIYLESLCDQPTFITHHPACLSPLSKHFACPQTKQIVAARAELFIQGREYANMYEEENSPFLQREKFREQLKYREIDGEGDAMIDEGYLEALEWGLPPTGGWGCGVDRLVMLFSGRERMGEVLSFGGLRNVVAAGRGGR